MKQALYQESYINKILLTKSLLINNYSKSLIRFSNKQKLAYILDNYNSIHKNLAKRTPARVGYNTKYGLKKNNRSNSYSLVIPSNLIVEYESSYVVTILFGLNLIPISRVGNYNLLNCLLLTPKRSVFKGYCLGVLGIMPKYQFLVTRFARSTIRYGLKKSVNKGRNTFNILDVLSKALFCIPRLILSGIVLKLKFKQTKFKYKKQFWLLPKRKPFYCFKAKFQVKSTQIYSFNQTLCLKTYAKNQLKKLKRALKRKKRRSKSVKPKKKQVYRAANKTFKKRLIKEANKNFLI